MLTSAGFLSEREAEILKPLSSLEVVEKEEANFDTEISEDDVVGEWKLRGQLLTRSPVRLTSASDRNTTPTHISVEAIMICLTGNKV